MITSETFVVVFCGASLRVHPALVLWLMREGFQARNIYWHCGGRAHHVDYNNGVKIALESGRDSLMFCDNDIHPMPGKTAPFLSDKYDMQCVKTDTGCDSWQSADAWHTGMWRASRETVERLGLPLFRWPTTADGSEITGCMCKPLVDKARSMGITTGHAGYADHTPKQYGNETSLIIELDLNK